MYRLLASAGIVDKERNYYWMGIYKHNNLFVINCVHGAKDGTLSIEWNNKEINFEPCELRGVIQYLTGIIIPKNRRIRICPCHPLSVKKHYHNELAENNIDVVGNWDIQTVGWVSNNYSTNKITCKVYVGTIEITEFDKTVLLGF